MATIDETSKTALLLLAGVAIFEMHRDMRESGPSLAELRQANSVNHDEVKQLLIDANIHTAILVSGVSILSVWATQSFIPAAILVLVYLGLAWCDHDLIKAPPIPITY
jgi:hypothetical protein